MTIETLPFDSARHLETEEDIAFYLQAVHEEKDPALLDHALGQVARAKAITPLARDTGLAREALYRVLSTDGNPELATVMKLLKAPSLRLSEAEKGSGLFSLGLRGIAPFFPFCRRGRPAHVRNLKSLNFGPVQTLVHDRRDTEVALVEPPPPKAGGARGGVPPLHFPGAATRPKISLVSPPSPMLIPAP